MITIDVVGDQPVGPYKSMTVSPLAAIVLRVWDR
jgi:hypothetical protein